VTVVLAGCGDLGIRVGQRLAATGYRVLGLRRHPERLPAPIAGQAVDLRRAVPSLPPDTDLVLVALTADAHTTEAYRDTYVTGLRHVLDATERDVPVPPHTLLVSSTAVYGVGDGRWIDEDTPAAPASPTGGVLREAEDLLAARLPEATVLRLAGLYGPGRGTLLAGVREGTATIPARPLYTNRIHRDDAAAAITHLLTRVAEPDPTYLGVDHQPVERAALLRFLADELGVPHPPVAEATSPRGRGKRLRGRRLRETGFTFAYPTYREGYRALIDASKTYAAGSTRT
jgi:nucleoside-diphosphate-sugar epimerase